ncbi:MAG TPA: UDP-N-acetylmuramoyl-tripeptide--D-alanyl-D-alanine ligase [Burkholderiaceae bacterium]|nr:UDP-N-acetylmuramoyl-tripeptide--D-alanyl-D-alanine ligase [Burkholderiaceae bacterium]
MAEPTLFTLAQAQGWLTAARLTSTRLAGAGDTAITGVSTDTRTIAPGQLFVAVRGDRFDANDFAAQAIGAGAAAVIVERDIAGLAAPSLVVADGRRALGELAIGWRRRFAIPLIAVTGSNGKTTVKEMIASVLAVSHGEAARFATPGNLNNDVGLPLSVLRLRDAHRVAVLELGMNHPGEIAWLATIAAPTVAMVNNAQREHQEFMPSVHATAVENGAVIAALAADGIAVFPGDDEHTPVWQQLAGARRTIRFGLTEDCDVRAAADARPEQFELSIGEQRTTVRLAIAGRHNVRNALAAAACCAAIGIDIGTIAAGLAAFRPVSGRLVRTTTRGGATLIDDSYNANPDSVRAAIDVLAAEPAPRALVLGDMGEVGGQGPQFHREVGAYARERGIERLLALGDATRDSVAAFGAGAQHCASLDELLAALRPLDAPGRVLLVKGSRFMRMERVAAALRGTVAAGGH